MCVCVFFSSEIEAIYVSFAIVVIVIATMDACLVTHPIARTVNTVKSMVLMMDAEFANRPKMDANWAVMVYCTDDIDCPTMGSTVVLDRSAAVADVLVANRLLLNSITILDSSKLYGFEGVAIAHRTLKIVFHNMMHRRQSNCIRMASVKRPPMLLAEHVQTLVTFDGHTMILKRLQRPRMLPLDRIVYSRSDIYQLDVELTSNPYRMDHGNRQVNLCHLLMCHCRLAFSCDLHNLNMDSLKPLLALHGAVTLEHLLPSNPWDMIIRPARKH